MGSWTLGVPCPGLADPEINQGGLWAQRGSLQTPSWQVSCDEPPLSERGVRASPERGLGETYFQVVFLNRPNRSNKNNVSERRVYVCAKQGRGKVVGTDAPSFDWICSWHVRGRLLGDTELQAGAHICSPLGWEGGQKTEWINWPQTQKDKPFINGLSISTWRAQFWVNIVNAEWNKPMILM